MALVEGESDAHKRDLLRWHIAVALAKTGDAVGASRTAASIADGTIGRTARFDIAVAEARAGNPSGVFAEAAAAAPRNHVNVLLSAVQTMLDEDRKERRTSHAAAIASLMRRSIGGR